MTTENPWTTTPAGSWSREWRGRTITMSVTLGGYALDDGIRPGLHRGLSARAVLSWVGYPASEPLPQGVRA